MYKSIHLNICLDTKEEGGVVAEELFKEYLLQKGKPNNYRKRPYSEEVIKFSLTMQGYSRKSYKYLRKSLEYSLPCEQTLYKYVKRVDAEPGISETSIRMIQNKVEEGIQSNTKVFLSIAMDDMSIRNNIWHDKNNIIGNEDIGDGPGTERATHACVMMATCVNGGWKIPTGFYFIDSKFSGESRAELLTQLVRRINETGAVVLNVTCDNCRVNHKMLKLLGLNLDPENLNSELDLFNVMNNRVCAVMDTPHLLKLTRNCLGDSMTLVNSDDEEINWMYVVQLHQLQLKEGLALANKLKKVHLEYQKNRMKVSFASQTLSQSVSNALIVCEEELQLPEFDGARPTAQFLSIFDIIFDIMNSRSLYGSFSKAPLRLKNMAYWNNIFTETETYIRGLRHQDGKSVLKGPRSAAFLGWLLNIRTLRKIFDQIVVEGHMRCICTFKLCQDSLENMFGSIRASLGNNNNPSCQQFKAAYKRIIIGALNKTDNGNCYFDDSISLLTLGLKCKSATAVVEKRFNFSEEELVIWTRLFDETSLISEYRDSVLIYIAGYIQRVLLRSTQCSTCASFLQNKKLMLTCSLIEVKDLGGLVRPCREVVRVVIMADRVFETAAKVKNLAGEKNVFLKLTIETQNTILTNDSSIFYELDKYCKHSINLVKKILSVFFTMRISHLCRTENSRVNSGLRNFKTKQVQRSHE